MNESVAKNKPAKSTGSKKNIIMMVVVILVTIASLWISLAQDFNTIVVDIGMAIANRPIWLFICSGIMLLSYFFDAMIFKVFSRLYTNRYPWYSGLAVVMIGTFYNDVTPGATGGQFMQAHTLSKQGIKISNAASIMVMWFILYQTSLVLIDFVAFGVEFETIMGIKSFPVQIFDMNFNLPMAPLIIGGFALNVLVIALLYIMSYWHGFHNFILNHLIGLLGKLKIVKNPDKTRESLRVQVENFKIELRRLQVNIPVTILIVILFMAVIFLRNSVPYYVGLALDAWPDEGYSFFRMMDCSFLSCFQQMVSGLVPLPGGAGISELVFANLFKEFFDYKMDILTAAQIMWRFYTFHIVLVAAGLTAALYRGSPKEKSIDANKQTFVDLQLETFAERKQAVDTLYETRQLSRKDIRDRIADATGKRSSSNKVESSSIESAINNVNQDAEPKKPKKPSIFSRKKKKKEDDDWDVIDV